MTVALIGPLPGSWKMTRDESGYRNYEIKHLVQCGVNDGPANALQCPGLPIPGSEWFFKDDSDVWAWCKLDMEVDPKTSNDKGEFFVVTNHFTTQGTSKKCCVEPVDDPLLEPIKISGSSVKFTKEGVYDRNGDRILNSAFEQLRGPQNEWDDNRHTVKIEQNVADLEFDLCNSMVNAVNSDVLWGLAARKVKLSSFTWDKKFRGDCNPYYVRTFEFEINFEGWDRCLVDEGTKVLNGAWYKPAGQPIGDYYRIAVTSDDNSTLNPDYDGNLDTGSPVDPDPSNPSHFIRFQDRNGNQARVILDGHGLPYNPDDTATTSWWVIVVMSADDLPIGTSNPVFEGTCSEAVDRAISNGATLLGPFTTEGEATVCGEDPEDDSCGDEQLPNDVECAEVSSPGKVRVEYYQESDFLILNIPTEL